jgi:hypothetical protein
MMLKSTSILLALCLVSVICPRPAYAASTGAVVKRISGCDYFMVNTSGGYAILEWYGGHDPDSGDLLIGKFDTYVCTILSMIPQMRA